MTSPIEASDLASERLMRSRARLRMAIRGEPHPDAADLTASDWLKGLDGLKGLAGLGGVLAALRLWWSQQPLRLAGLTVSEAATTVLKPLAQRHPLGFALSGMVAGALLVQLKPWRWWPAAALLSGLAPQAIGKMVSAVPLQSWLAALARFSAAQSLRKPSP